jgi:hypothetical protein
MIGMEIGQRGQLAAVLSVAILVSRMHCYGSLAQIFAQPNALVKNRL